MFNLVKENSSGNVFSWDNLFLVVSSSPNPDLFANNFHQNFLQNQGQGLFNALKTAIQTVNFGIAAVAIEKNVLYCASSSGGVVKVFRDSHETIILDGSTTNVASGYVKADDRITLSVGSSSAEFAVLNQKEMVINTPPSLPMDVKKPSLWEKIKENAQKRIYVKQTPVFEMESQSKKTTLSIGVILLMILGVSIIFGIKQKNTTETKAKYQDVLIAANKDLDESIGLFEVSPDRARELFVSAQEKLSQIEVYADKDKEISSLKSRVEEQKKEIFKEYDVKPELFSDLTLLSSGFKGNKITLSEDNIYILDKDSKKIVTVGVDDKKSKVVAGGDIVGEVIDLASYSDRVFTLDNAGINEIDNQSKNVIPKDWSDDVLIYGFAGNIYALNKNEGQIYRYAGAGESFGSKQNWLASSVKADFSSVKAWNIDGAIYVLKDDGKIQKFSQGNPQNFNLSGVFPGLTNIESIYSGDETEFLYILDTQGRRVVVTDKKGVYKAQYTGDGINQAKGLVVSEKEKKIILLTGEKLLSIEIKHL